MTLLSLVMDRVDTLDTLLFGKKKIKNKNKNNFFVVIDLYYNPNIFNSKSIKNIFFKSDLKGVHPVHLVQYYDIRGVQK